MDAVDDLCRPDKVGGTWLTKLDLGMIRAHALHNGRDSSCIESAEVRSCHSPALIWPRVSLRGCLQWSEARSFCSRSKARPVRNRTDATGSVARLSSVCVGLRIGLCTWECKTIAAACEKVFQA
jgi:hypothetical protein